MAIGAAWQNSSNTHTMTAANSNNSARESLLLFPLQFTCSDGAEGLNDAQSHDQLYDPVVEVQRIQRALGSLTEAEVQLAAAVQEAKASSVLSTGGVDLWAVGSYLRSKHGCLVSLRRANASKRPSKAYLRQLRHDFLVVRGLPGIEAVDVLVDLNFRDHFRVSHATPWYAKMLAALPQDWVGTAAALAPLVGLMSAGIRLCFRAAAIPLPPWREGRAMLSKWVTELHSDELLPLMPMPDPALRRLLAPYHTPFRTAVQQAGGGSTGSSSDSSAAHLSILGWDKPGQLQPQQQQAYLQQQQQQAAHAHVTTTGASGGLDLTVLPPLPTAATAGAPAAAHHGAKEDQQHGHQQQHHHTCDVPRKIIVGFPVASLPLAHSPHLAQPQQPQQQEGYQQQGLLLPPHGATDGSATCVVKLEHGHQLQQQDSGCAAFVWPQQQQQQQQGHSSKPQGLQGPLPPQQQQQGAAAPAAAPAAAAKGPALAQLDSSSSQQRSNRSSAENTAAAAAAAAGPVAPVRPAFSSTAGVVVGSGGGTSPNITVSKQWVQQLTEGAVAAGSDKGRAAAALAAAVAAAPAAAAAAGAGAPPGVGGGAVGVMPEGSSSSSTSAAAAAVAVRHFKTLDQLLPRMRTVKLGAG